MRARSSHRFPMLPALALVGMLWAPWAASGPSTVRDLAWGEVLFFFYQDDYIPAITRVGVAMSRDELDFHGEEAELVLGGMLLGYGMHRRAQVVFESLLDSHPRPWVRDQAWYFLAQVRYQRGLPEEALEALDRVGADLPDRLVPEQVDLEARALLAVGRPADAAQLLAGRDLPGGWDYYGRYNLGIALARADSAAQGDEVLDALGQAPVRGVELSSLRDRANLALGSLRLAREDMAGARAAFDRVRLEGPYSSRALLGAGWSDAARGDYAAALGPWDELGQRDPLDAAVQESLIALPYAYAQLGAPGRAVDGYERAVAGYEDELGRLDRVMGRVRNGMLADSLRESDYQGPSGETVVAGYLASLMTRDEFRRAAEGLRDLDALDRLLAGWQSSMEAFSDMLEARQARFDSRRAPILAAVDTDRLDRLRVRYTDVSERVDAARARDDVLAFADARQRRLLDRIAAAESLAAMESPAAARLRRLRGVVYWEANNQFPRRLREAEKALRACERTLALAGRRVDEIRAADVEAPRRFIRFEARIGAARQKLAALRDRVSRATARQISRLDQLATDELQARRRRVSAYLAQARFALAASYDRATVAEAER